MLGIVFSLRDPFPFSRWHLKTRHPLHQGLWVLLPPSPSNAEELKVKVKVPGPSRWSLQVPSTGRDFSKSCICLAFKKYLKVTSCAYIGIFNIKDNISNFFTSSFLRYSSVEDNQQFNASFECESHPFRFPKLNVWIRKKNLCHKIKELE